jgi:hypothetical protein
VPAEEQLQLDWVPDVGALVPLLDLANHAPMAQANTVLVVRVSHSPHMFVSLMAIRDIAPGEQVRGASRAATAASWAWPLAGALPPAPALRRRGAPPLARCAPHGAPAAPAAAAAAQIRFSYMQEEGEVPPGEEGGSRCNDRWLLEYGFTVQDGLDGNNPARDCHSLNMTATAVLQLLQLQGLPEDAQLDLEAAAGVAGGCEQLASCWHVLQLDGQGMVPRPAFDWLAGLLGGDEQLAEQVLALLLRQELQQLRGAVEGEGSAGAGAAAASEEDGMGVGGCDGLAQLVLQVLQGSARAVAATLSSMGYAAS